MVAAGRLYAVHCLWWVRRSGQERCRGKGRERVGRVYLCFHQHRHEHRAEGENQAPGGEGESSLALYANQQDPKPQMSHDLQWEGRVGRALSRANTAKQEGCVSSEMMSLCILRKWCQASAVMVSPAAQCLYGPAVWQRVDVIRHVSSPSRMLQLHQF